MLWKTVKNIQVNYKVWPIPTVDLFKDMLFGVVVDGRLLLELLEHAHERR